MNIIGIDESKNFRCITGEVVEWAYEERKKEDGKIGVLLCEGDIYSIDMAVYEVVFPDLLVVPVGGCCNVSRLLPKIREMLSTVGMYAYGIIDRDALSKKETKKLFSNKGIYTTKLPFIENIICSPEVIRIICQYLEINPNMLINQVETELLKILWQKLKEALPINLGIEKNERIYYLEIGAATKKQKIEKKVDKSSILYSYRDKIITNIVGTHIGLRGSKKEYYNFIKRMLSMPEYRDDMIKAFSVFVPKFELYDLGYTI